MSGSGPSGASGAEDGHRPFARAEIEQSIPSRFAEQVGRHPERLAICSAAHRWTYAALSERVDALAREIVRRCGGHAGRVALLFDHDAPMCAGVLAALRAAKTYVPLDPLYPEQRLAAMLADSAAELIVAERAHVALAERLSGGATPVVVAEEVGAARGERLPQAAPSDLAYVLYTSGSTGRPKGVVQNHRNVLHFIRAYTNALELCPADRLTLLSSYAFDAAVMAIYGALLNGACLHPRSVRAGGFRELGGWMRASGVTVYHSTPTVFRHFAAACPEGARFGSVRRVVLGGEPVVRSDVDTFRRLFVEGAILVNGLGPTESTVTLQHFVDHRTELTGFAVPVGRPVCDTEVVLLDDAGRESRTEGEITFLSDHLAVGYWGRPDLDARAFGVHPPGPGGRRCYRSGDLGRWRPDGTLEFLGRKDLQVKIRGVRVELAEVEGTIELQPGVARCVASATAPATPGTDEAQLVAYLQPRPGAVVDVEALRDRLRLALPDAMVPSAFVVIDEFPMTPTGKIDRLALSRREPARAAAGGRASAAELRTDAERQLAAVWRGLLGVQAVGRDDDFFAMGGDSLTAVRLVDEIERVFSTRIALGHVFTERTLGALARALATGDALGQSAPSIVPLRRGEGDGAHLYCLCGIQLYQALADAIAGPHAVSGVFLPIEERLLTGAELPRLQELAAMYGAVVRAAQPEGPYHLAGVSFGGMLAFELARQLRAAGEEVGFLGVFDTALPQTITRGDRIKAHARLAWRRGPGYVRDKLEGKLGRISSMLAGRRGRASPPPERSRREALVATRARIYTHALDLYRREMPSYDGRMWFFRATEGDDFAQLSVPLDYHWSRFATRCEVHEIAGGHISMLAPPGVDVLGAVVRRALDEHVRERTRRAKAL